MDPGMDKDIYDVIIVGAGPTGLFGAFYGGLRGMRVKLIDSLDYPGGQLTALYPEKLIYDVAGFPAVLAKTLVSELIKQAYQYKPALASGEQVLRLARDPQGVFEISTNKGVHHGKTVVISVGAGAFAPKKLPGVNCDEYEGRGLSYFVRDLSTCKNKRMLVVGGGDSAVDWALTLLRVTNDITLIHRAEQFRAHEDSINKLMSSAVKVRTHYELRRIQGEKQIESAVIYDNRTNDEETLAVDGVLVNIGFSSSLGPIREWGLELDKEGIVVNSRMETNIPGVYAAGDVASYSGKLKLIVTGFADATIAVNYAKTFIDPASKSFPGHSSAMIPKQRQKELLSRQSQPAEGDDPGI